MGILNKGAIKVSVLPTSEKLTSAPAGATGNTKILGATYDGNDVETVANTKEDISLGKSLDLLFINLCIALQAAYRATKYSASSGKSTITVAPCATVGIT